MGDAPRHVAIIMDGNRRWASQKGASAAAGHREGAKSIERVIEAADRAGVEILTLYAFSTENWKRPRGEVRALMGLLEAYIDSRRKNLMDKNIRLGTIGRLDRFSPALRRKIEEVKNITGSNSGIMLNLALDYGGRDEIVRASRRIAEDVKKGILEASDISEALFAGYLYTGGLPDPELLIRTGGDLRISNFLLWQVSYAEIYVTKKFWPEFREKDFKKALVSYKKRVRRLGG